LVEGIWLAYVLFIPGFIIVEGRYLLRHPKTFRAPAVFVYVGVVGLSVIFALSMDTLVVVPFMLAGAVGAYYFVKMWCHSRVRSKKWGR